MFLIQFLMSIFSDLKKMDIGEIINTFSLYRGFLRDLFRKNKNIPDSRFEPDPQYLLIVDELLEPKQQHAMMRYLKMQSEFGGADTADDITSFVCYYSVLKLH